MSARLLLLLFCGALTACSSFDARWRAAKDRTAAYGPTLWDGRWTSAKHRTLGGAPEGGRLRCVLSSINNAEYASGSPELRADFHANWLLFSSGYTMSLMPVKGAPTEFRGTHELPAVFGGTYRYTARITGERFTARYDSSYDHGTFDLTRVRP